MTFKVGDRLKVVDGPEDLIDDYRDLVVLFIRLGTFLSEEDIVAKSEHNDFPLTFSSDWKLELIEPPESEKEDDMSFSVTAGLTLEAQKALETLAQMLNLSNTDVVNQSLIINYELMKVQGKGLHLMVHDPKSMKSTELHIVRASGDDL